MMLSSGCRYFACGALVAAMLCAGPQGLTGAYAQRIDLKMSNPLLGLSSGRLPAPQWGSPAGPLYTRAWAYELQQIDAIGRGSKCDKAAWERGRIRLEVLKQKARNGLDLAQENIRREKPDEVSALARFLQLTRDLHGQDIDFTIFDHADLALWAEEAMSRLDHIAIESYVYPPFDCDQALLLPSDTGRQGMTVPGRPAGLVIPASFTPALARISTDGQAYCTHGPANALPVVFTPADENGNPLPPVFNIGDTGRGRGGGVDSAMNDPHVQTGDDGVNGLSATPGPDDMAGGKNKDEFYFHTNTVNPGDPTATLDDGDRIRDYESGEGIVITGVRLGSRNVKVEYDPEKDETRLELDFPDPNTGQGDGQPDKTIILNGDQRGTVQVDANCCSQETTEIRIKTAKSSQPRTAGPPAPQESTPQSTPQQSTPQQSTPQSSPPQQATPKQTPDQSLVPPGGRLEQTAQRDAPVETDAPNANAPDDLTVHISFKATEEVLQSTAALPELKGQVAKLTVPDEPALPKTGGRKPTRDTGHDRDPVTCVTGATGTCTARIAPDERKIYGFPATGGRSYRANLDLRQATGAVVEQGATQLALKDPPAGAHVATSNFMIGDRTFTRIDVRAPEAMANGLLETYKASFGSKYQVDFCGEKKPGPPLGMETVATGAVGDELPHATMVLGRTGGAVVLRRDGGRR